MFTTVMLDQPRRIRYRPGLAQYRLGEIKKPLPLSALKNGRKFLTALCQWVWVVLDEDHSFESPEALADIISEMPVDKQVELASGVIDCLNLYKPPADLKKADGANGSPSPASA
jgi:hypothetical protein